MKNIFFLFVLYFFFIGNVLSFAETSCTAKVTYTWHSEGEEKEREETFLEMQSSAENEEKAKEALKSIYARRQKQALEECRKKHENLSGCISSRLQSASQVLSLLSFTAKREMEKSIINDCKKQNGKCLKVNFGDIHCAVSQKEEQETNKEEGTKKKKK
ncbi:MAG: hypothetical protein D6780_03085 [Candidatus Dadabacteria bacterium]|nr:MAG: hypothetical protein D6780_03085 [Candidatus Dadabacteria bacterium]